MYLLRIPAVGIAKQEKHCTQVGNTKGTLHTLSLTCRDPHDIARALIVLFDLIIPKFRHIVQIVARENTFLNLLKGSGIARVVWYVRT